MVRNFQSEDKDKSVTTADGDMVGTVESVSGSSAHIKPAENLSQSTRRRLGWSEEGEDSYELRHSSVENITNDEIQLKKDF